MASASVRWRSGSSRLPGARSAAAARAVAGFTGGLAACPASLRRLERRGLEILAAGNYGPHTKYYPYVASTSRHTVPLVTADDDIIYPPEWLALLVDAGERHPGTVSAHWVSIMGTEGGQVAGTQAGRGPGIPPYGRKTSPPACPV